MNTQIIAIANQKGGVGKTTTCANLGIGLAQAGKKVLLIDGDPQGSLTISLGNPQPDKLPFTLSDAMGRILMDEPLRPGEGILHHPEGVDLMPADIQLSGMEVSLVNAMSRETILRQYLDTLKGQYSHILIDCQPSLGMLTVNALAAANRIIIPVQAEYLPAKGLEQLLSTVNKVKRQINPKLQIDGILLTMVDSRTNFAKEISALLRETYGSKIKVFGTEIPHSVRAKEISAEGKSIFAHDPGGKVAEGYKNLTKEVLKLEKQREAMKRQAGRPSKENCSQVGNDFGKKSSEVLAEQVGQSKNQIFRYIRLTELIPELMDMVDEKKIALNPAYELSFLKKDEQVDLLDAMDSEQATPSLSQAQRLKKYSQEGHLTLDMMRVIMGEEKKSDLDRVTFTSDTLRKYFPKSYTPQRMQETIIKLLEAWQKKRQRDQER